LISSVPSSRLKPTSGATKPNWVVEVTSNCDDCRLVTSL
jgi:hypothetical protein